MIFILFETIRLKQHVCLTGKKRKGWNTILFLCVGMGNVFKHSRFLKILHFHLKRRQKCVKLLFWKIKNFTWPRVSSINFAALRSCFFSVLFWSYFGLVFFLVLVFFRSCFGLVLILFWSCFRLVMVLFWSCFRLVLVLFWSCFGLVLVFLALGSKISLTSL